MFNYLTSQGMPPDQAKILVSLVYGKFSNGTPEQIANFIYSQCAGKDA